jgi:hypothetical protein
MHRRQIPVGVVSLLGVLLLTQAPAAADDFRTCRDERGDRAIAACTRAIESGEFSPSDLIVLLHNRAAEYRNKGDRERAAADVKAAMDIEAILMRPFRWDQPSRGKEPAVAPRGIR